MKSNVTWVNQYNGHPERLTPITVYPFRNRVSLNPVYGCTLACKYCICSADPAFSGSQRIELADVDETVDALIELGDQIDGFFFNIFDHSDPFLPDNQKMTLSLMKRLAQHGFSQPVIITSKLSPPFNLLKEIAELPLKTTVFTSMADAGGCVEFAPIEERIKLVRNSHNANLHTILLLRPVHRAWTIPEQLEPVLQQMDSFVDGVVISGLRSPDAVCKALSKAGIDILYLSKNDSLPSQDAELESRITAIISSHLPGIPIFRKRACAVNRRYNLECMSASAEKYKWPEDVKQNIAAGGCILKRDYNGYCQLVPKAKTEKDIFTLEKKEALESLSLLFDAAPQIEWCVIGSAAEVVQRKKADCKDIDVKISSASFHYALQRLENSSRAIQMKCCSTTQCNLPISNLSNDSNQSIIHVLEKYRKVAIVMIGNVKIDLSANNALEKVTRIPVGSFQIPFEFYEAA